MASHTVNQVVRVDLEPKPERKGNKPVSFFFFSFEFYLLQKQKGPQFCTILPLVPHPSHRLCPETGIFSCPAMDLRVTVRRNSLSH